MESGFDIIHTRPVSPHCDLGFPIQLRGQTPGDRAAVMLSFAGAGTVAAGSLIDKGSLPQPALVRCITGQMLSASYFSSDHNFSFHGIIDESPATRSLPVTGDG